MTEIEHNILALKDLKHKITDVYESEISKVNVKLSKILDHCPHSESETTKRYVEGGYLNQSKYIRTTKCIVCGIKLDEKIEYGGFG